MRAAAVVALAAALVGVAVASATRERTTTCSSAYTDKPTAADWNALVQKGVYTRVE